jgi:hypothetical protein
MTFYLTLRLVVSSHWSLAHALSLQNLQQVKRPSPFIISLFFGKPHHPWALLTAQRRRSVFSFSITLRGILYTPFSLHVLLAVSSRSGPPEWHDLSQASPSSPSNRSRQALPKSPRDR